MKRKDNLMLISIAVLIVAYESYNAFTLDDPFARSGNVRLSSTGSYSVSSVPSPISAMNSTTKKEPVASPKEGKPRFTQGVTDELEARYDEVNQNADYPTLEQRIEEMQGRREGRQFAPQMVIQQMEQSDIWQESDEPGPALTLTDEERHDGRSFVQFEPLRIESLMAGDLLELPLPLEKTTYTLLIESVEVGDHGDITWNGRIAEYSNDNQVTITQGKQLTVAGITTPLGQYVLEARQGSGWIAAGGDLFKQDFEVTDEVAVKSTNK